MCLCLIDSISKPQINQYPQHYNIIFTYTLFTCKIWNVLSIFCLIICTFFELNDQYVLFVFVDWY